MRCWAQRLEQNSLRAASTRKPSPAVRSRRKTSAQTDSDERPRVRAAFTGPAATGLEAIAAVDAQFNPDDFTKGARKAYELIVNAYADGDRDALRQLVDDDVFEVYTQAIADREKAGTEPMRLVRLRSARIVEASLDEEKMARVAVSFESELSDGDAHAPGQGNLDVQAFG